MQEFEGDLAFELDIAGGIHHAHPSGTEPSCQLKSTQFRWLECGPKQACVHFLALQFEVEVTGQITLPLRVPRGTLPPVLGTHFPGPLVEVVGRNLQLTRGRSGL